MDSRQPAALAASVAALAAAGPAAATTYEATLTAFAYYSNGGTSGANGNITSSTATWSYDDVTNLLTQTGGTFNVRFTAGPTQTLYRTLTTGLVVGNGNAASAATYQCAEGNFGAAVGASICGNYHFGANFTNESTTSWGPGTASSRTLGGDDGIVGPQQSLATTFDGMNTVSWAGSTLRISNRDCVGPCTTIPAGGYNKGYIFTLTVVPLPGAAWLFGPALAGLGALRRRPGA